MEILPQQPLIPAKALFGVHEHTPALCCNSKVGVATGQHWLQAEIIAIPVFSGISCSRYTMETGMLLNVQC